MPFVEVGQDNYDSHADNFVCHKANMKVLDPAWSGLLQTCMTAACSRTRWSSGWARSAARRRSTTGPAATTTSTAGPSCWPAAASRAASSTAPTDADGKDVKDNPVTEGDLFATIYTALGINPRAKHYVGTRPIWATPEGAKPVRAILG